MTTIRIEERFFSDVRVDVFVGIAGFNRFEAIGRLIHLWRICVGKESHVVTDAIVLATLGPTGVDALLTSELGSRVDDGIAIRGVEGRLDLLQSRKKSGQTRSQKGRRNTVGRLSERDDFSQHAGEVISKKRENTDDFSQHAGEVINPRARSRAYASESEKNTLSELGRTKPKTEPREAASPPSDSSDFSLRSPAPKSKNSRTKSPEIHLPADWNPSADHAKIARDENVDVLVEARNMRDWAESGGKTCVSWDARFRKWLRNSKSFGGPVSSKNYVAPVSTRRFEDVAPPTTNLPPPLSPVEGDS